MRNYLKGYLNYTEIYRKREEIKPKFLWFISFGKFIDQKRDFHNKVVLDFGCDIESAALGQFVKQNASDKNYFGYDVAKTVVEWLKNKKYFYDFWKDDRIKFDVINASQVYEHLTEDMREKFILRSQELLKEGGILYADFPYIQNLNLIDFFQASGIAIAICSAFGNFFSER